MTDFAYRFCGTWKDGEMPSITPVFIVSHDQTNRAYQIQAHEYDAFLWWVTQTWARSDDHMQDDETPDDYLARIGVHIRPVAWS